MQHKWTDEEGVKHNFCIKCGIKKSCASSRPCSVSMDNWKKNLSHVLIEEYKNYVGKPKSKCKHCGVEVNRRWSNYPIVTDEKSGPNVYVPYVESHDDDGKLIKRTYTSNSKYQHKKQERLGRVIKFWLIACAYTEDEIQIRDIIL